jgi:hypothetical protein
MLDMGSDTCIMRALAREALMRDKFSFQLDRVDSRPGRFVGPFDWLLPFQIQWNVFHLHTLNADLTAFSPGQCTFALRYALLFNFDCS